jgi:hypothetical protein
MTPTDAQTIVDELLQASWDYELSSPDDTRIHEVYLALKQRVIAAITAAALCAAKDAEIERLKRKSDVDDKCIKNLEGHCADADADADRLTKERDELLHCNQQYVTEIERLRAALTAAAEVGKQNPPG